MKKIFEIALGIVTSIGGFLEIGSLAFVLAVVSIPLEIIGS